MRDAANSSWLTAREIANMRLTGLPTTERGIQLRANAEDWPTKDRPGKGGGRVYNALALPQAARDDFVSRQLDAVAATLRPRGRPVGTGFFDRHPDVADAIEARIAESRVSARNMLKLLATDGFPELPTKRTLQRFMAQLEERNKVLFTALRDPDRYKSRHRLALGRMDATVSYAHEMWEIDTTKADVICTDGRKCVLGIIDRWCRRSRFLVVESESAQSVRRMLVTTISAWGVMPAILKVDNGSGFMNATIESALKYLDIELDPCLPGTPEDKPHVERLFGTFMRERASLLPGFSGHSVADAQKLRAKNKKKTGRAEIVAGISSQELQAVLDNWVDGEYHQRTHSTLRMPPMEKWQRSPQPARAAAPEPTLRLALSAYVGTAKVGKRGVQWKNGRYWSPALVQWQDRMVVLRRDEEDLGALFIFDEDDNYIDTAVNAERSGLSEQEFAMWARGHQKRALDEAKAEIKRKQKRYPMDRAVTEMLREEAALAGKVAFFPIPTVEHVTPAMASMAVPPAFVVDQPPNDTARRENKPDAPARTLSVEERVARADAIILAHRQGEAVDPAKLEAAQVYATEAEYLAHKTVFGHFNQAEPFNPIANQTRRHGAA